jgi:hypothetical protein
MILGCSLPGAVQQDITYQRRRSKRTLNHLKNCLYNGERIG